MQIFIGSSRESKDYMRQVASVIEEQGHEPLRWDKPGLFIAGKYTLESLESIAKKVDAAVFIFNSDDKLWYRNDVVGSVRDNVLIEYGLFCGTVSRMKSCICCVNNPRVASDLNGITYIDLTHMTRAEINIIEWLKSIISPSYTISESLLLTENEKIANINNRYVEYKKNLIADATMGNNESRYILGKKYFTGDIAGFDQNPEEAYKWTKLAADENYIPALNLMGELYYRGYGASQNFIESFMWHKKAEDNGHLASCGTTAFMYKTGLGCEQDFDESEKYYKKGISLGLKELNTALGELYEHYKKDFHKAVEHYKLASAFSGNACYRLGIMYQYGLDGKKSDFLEAGRWFREAATKGHTDAKYQLGNLYYHGCGFPRDLKQAIKWYERAAEKGHGEAQYTLGYLYLHGLDVDKNDEIALMWAKKAAEQGYMFSQRHAGEIYIRQKKYHLAFEMFKLSADQGCVSSHRRLGDLYALGLYENGEDDYGSAVKYYQLAAEQGDELAKKGLELQSIPLLDVK